MALTQNSYPTIHPKRILLIGPARNGEAIAASAITPGNLVELNSVGKVRNHATSGGKAEAMFAQEDALQGNGIEDDYAAAAPVSLIHAEKGAVVFAWLTAGNSVDPSVFLSSNGDGTLKPVAGSDVALAKCLDTLSSASDATKSRIRVRIL